MGGECDKGIYFHTGLAYAGSALQQKVTALQDSPFLNHSLFFGFLEPHLFLLPRVAMPLLVLWVIELSPIFLYFFTSGNSPFVNKPSSGYPKKSMPSVFSWNPVM